MSNQQLLIGGALLWFWMQRDKKEAPKTIIVTKSSTTPPPASKGQSATDALRNQETLEQTREREKTKREAQYLDAAKSGLNTASSFISGLMK